MSNKMISSKEACDLLGVNRSTLSRWAADGTLSPVHKLPGTNGAFLFDRRAVERLHDDRETAKAAS